MGNEMTADELLENLAKRFEFHGNNAYGSSDPRNNSPLYRELALRVAKDTEILKLVTEADRATQIPNLLMGAVHYLLMMRDYDHPLGRYYLSLTDSPLPPEGAYPHFREFCLSHADEIRRLVTTRRIQTNEVGRCTALVPAFEWVVRQHVGMKLAMIEIGASAGLNMLWDRYGYEYRPGGKVGDADAMVQLPCEVRGTIPPLPEAMPEVVWRVGIDINPLIGFVHDESEMLWLQALIWPEQADRAEQLERAINEARRTPPEVRKGSAPDVIEDIIEEAPSDAHLVIYHSYTLNQMPQDVGNATRENMQKASETRDFTRIALEWWAGEPAPTLDAYEYRGGEMMKTRLGICESHGRWLEWQAG